MHRSNTPPPDSARTRSTMPPGDDDENAKIFEMNMQVNGETETRLHYLARVYGLRAIK